MADSINWSVAPKVITASARGSLASLLERIAAECPDWVVIVRVHPASGLTYHYAWRVAEIRHVADGLSAQQCQRDLEASLQLHERGSSRRSRGRRIEPLPAGVSEERAARTVDLDADGQVVAIGEPATTMSGPSTGRSGTRGGFAMRENFPGASVDAAASPVPTPATIGTTISAQAPAEVQLQQLQLIEFRIEVRDTDAKPLPMRVSAQVQPDKPIVVDLSVARPLLAVVGPSQQVVPPPLPGQPRVGFFQVSGQAVGLVQLSLTFRQGASELGSIGLAVDVVAAGASSAQVSAHGQVSTPDASDDDMLQLLIEQRLVDGKLRYEYKLYSEALGFNFLTLQSNALLDRGEGEAKTLLDYVDRIYERTTAEVRSVKDLEELQRKLRALGGSLSLDLFDKDVARALWPLRARIGLIRITSWEPYIPWELLRLHDPDRTGEFDERFLAEYGLIRSQHGAAPAREFALKDWCWMAAEFPLGTHLPAGDTSWFSDTLPQVHGLSSIKVAADASALLKVLHDGAFDVLHLACHAEAAQNKIDRATLIIGDRAYESGAPELIQLAPEDVKTEARLSGRRPLVFLNACESGRLAPDLTAWGGWPEVFLKAGAGAFVGTSWAVRDKPATVFARTFYEALLAGKRLHQAADDARAAARALGDSSWLAFKVYGHPFATRAP
ncbi:CHAT domain-containing protein [Variovorax saccharolyticus]|uniref:CHAT domain-containing protein n=1 Tax=Variovorax saccharolyticus TaxID=3053516 RepID=UPI0025768868|nr:CHAT domain-containing protein [Variovorax sp. J22R187]MDM0022161.1 CHAT domain-containing protein [Variovorax sp. J22R187]